MSAVKLHNFLYLSVPTTSQTHICTMKQRRTWIMGPSRRRRRGTQPASADWIKPGHTARS